MGCVLSIRRWWWAWLIGLFVLAFVGGATYFAAQTVRDREASDREADRQRQTISAQQRQVIECQSPTGDDPVRHTCYEDNQQRLGEILVQVAREVGIESDCRNRRRVNGFAAPDPALPCTAQTPHEVYPGRSP